MTKTYHSYKQLFDMGNPLLSICVPTYNRKQSLALLLKDLSFISKEWPILTEICISDNCSTDGTDSLLKSFSLKHCVSLKTQSSNLGASRNVVDVCRLASGRWLLVVGDDDRLELNALEGVLQFLKIIPAESWVLMNAVHVEKKSNGICKKTTRLSNFAAKRLLIFHGTAGLGFIGCHLIPAAASQKANALSSEILHTWPHLTMLFRHISCNGTACLYPTPIVKQAASGILQYWPIDAFVQMELRKVSMCLCLAQTEQQSLKFLYFAAFRHFYSVWNIAFAICWKLKDPAHFQQNCIATYTKVYKYFGHWRLLTVPYLIIILIIYGTPNLLIRKVIPKHILDKMDNLNSRESHMPEETNGILRGL